MNGFLAAALAKALGVAPALVSGWLSENEPRRPDSLRRRALKIVTDGAVDEGDWDTDEEAAYLAALHAVKATPSEKPAR